MSLTPSIWHVSHFRDNSGQRTAQEAKQNVSDLEERLDKLALICHAMWDLIREKTTLTETDLLQRVQDLDLRDGVADGRKTQVVSKCPQCERTMSPRHQRCLYCGHEKLMGGAFDGM